MGAYELHGTLKLNDRGPPRIPSQIFRSSVTLDPAERHFCKPHSYGMPRLRSENIAGSINQPLVRSSVIESRITSFSRGSLGAREDPWAPDYPIGTGFPFVDRHSSVFSRRILLYLFLSLFHSLLFRSRTVVSSHPLPSFSRGPLGTEGLAREGSAEGVDDSRGDKDQGGGVKG